MPRRTKLSNCYLPLPLPSSSNTEATEKSDETTSSVRYDGRSAGYELRRLCLETSVISRALGSSLVELGHTKVLAEVHIAAASTSTSSNNSNKIARYGNLTNEASNDIGCLKFHVKYIPFIGIDQILQREQTISPLDGTATTVTNNNTGNGGAGATQHTVTIGKLNQELISRESELSRQLTAALLPVIILDRYPKCAVVVSVMVLQDDGCCLSTAITAASMALVDAKIEIRDVVTSCTVAVVDSNSSSSSSSSSSNNNDNDDNNNSDINSEESTASLRKQTNAGKTETDKLMSSGEKQQLTQALFSARRSLDVCPSATDDRADTEDEDSIDLQSREFKAIERVLSNPNLRGRDAAVLFQVARRILAVMENNDESPLERVIVDELKKVKKVDTPIKEARNALRERFNISLTNREILEAQRRAGK